MIGRDYTHLVKNLLALSAGLIAIGSLIAAHVLVNDLNKEERSRMEVWAEAMRVLNNADSDTNLSLVLKVINENNTIPVIVTDEKGNVQSMRNVDIEAENQADSLHKASVMAARMRAMGKFIRIDIDREKGTHIDVCYDESVMLHRLAIYPYIQLGIVMIVVVAAIITLLMSKRFEQDKVWVGLTKETAHQLGTPISSLMAWVEILHEQYPNDELVPEIDKDVRRLQLIADRFSKVGSKPEMRKANLNEMVEQVVEYMNRRTSRSITMTLKATDEINLFMNNNLLSWVIENLCKNAVDAMGGQQGHIDITIQKLTGTAIIEVKDSGKGIKKSELKKVFKPGFTTKKRGWGLGLSLAKRIVEEYHNGKIWVKESEPGIGTTFRIELPA